MEYDEYVRRQTAEAERIKGEPPTWLVALAATCTFLSTVIIVGVLTHRWLVLSLPNIGVN